MTAPRYATVAQARADAERLAVAQHVGTVPVLLLSTVEQVALNPRSSSDTLLITADALREAAGPLEGTPLARALRHLADTLAAIAPTRATPLPTSQEPIEC